MRKIIRENKKWRIILDSTSDKDTKVLVNDFYVGRGVATRCRLRLGKATAMSISRRRDEIYRCIAEIILC